MVRAIACMVLIFALLIGGFFLLPNPPEGKGHDESSVSSSSENLNPVAMPDDHKMPPAKPKGALSNVALTIIDVIGDGRNVKPGAVTLTCLATADDAVTDQLDRLKRIIWNYPGTTQYINGVYVTMSANDRRPVYQIRYPSPAYCSSFLEAFNGCYGTISKDLNPQPLAEATLECIKQAAGTLRVQEEWAGLIEANTKK